MRSEITTILFSKNRACQLELLLRSMRRFQFSYPVTILYTFDKEFEAGYQQVIHRYPEMNFVKETNFKQQLLEMIGEYTMFLVDDDIMIDHFDAQGEDFGIFKRNPLVICLSLRLSPRYENAPYMPDNRWHWVGLKKDWGYPMSATSHIFRRDDIFLTLLREPLDIPNDIEARLRCNVPYRPMMMCTQRPIFINNLVTQVQTKYPNYSMMLKAEDLEKRFVAGEQIDLDDMLEKAKQAKGCFMVKDFKWEKI